jgi:hypothetical protein
MPVAVLRNAVKSNPAGLCGIRGSAPQRGGTTTSNEQAANADANPQAFGSGFFDFRKTQLGNKQITVSGISKDSTGAVLGGCIVDLFRVLDPTNSSEPPLLWHARTTSDATTGAYSFLVPSNGWRFQVVSYKAGAPDVAGVTVNTLFGM